MISIAHSKTLMLPIAMVGGAVLYPWMHYVTFLSPYLIFLMLFITYCKLNFSDFKPHKVDVTMLSAQMAMAAAAYFIILPLNKVIAEGVLICFFIPTATAAPVITSMLGGSITRVATFSLISNIFVACAGPFILAAAGEHAELTFWQSFLLILSKVFPLLILPIAAAFTVRYCFPRLHSAIVGHQQLSFYLWAISLFIVVGSCVSFTINHWSLDDAWLIICLAILALPACLIQFKVGRKIGRSFGDCVSGGQSLGQKNTVLAVWLALTYMNPLASIAPAAYIAWQNALNSWQLIRHERSRHM